MEQDKTMLELRKIRDANSKRHMKMSFEEMKKEEEETLKWLEQKVGRSIQTTNRSAPKLRHAN